MSRSEIMKQAWRFFRSFNITFSKALKKAWEMAKCFNNDVKLPVLQGSEKQVKCANKIRKNLIENLENEMKYAGSLLRKQGYKITKVERILAALALKQELKNFVKADDLINLEVKGEFDTGIYYLNLIKNYKLF